MKRFAGSRGGLSVDTPTGPAPDAELVLHQLTGSATSNQFRTLFAFSLDELQEAGSLQGSSIYSAGQGAPGLPALQQRLSADRSKIYLSGGSKQEVPQLLDTLKDIDKQLKAVEGNAGLYGRRATRKSEIDRELQSIDVELLRLNGRRSEIERLLSGRDDWVALSVCDERLEEMPWFEQFPENPIPRLESLEGREREARSDKGAVDEQLRQAVEAANIVIPSEDLLTDAARIEEVLRARSSFDGSVRDLPDREAELRELEAKFVENLRDLGQDWDEAALEAFDTSLVTRNQVEQWKQRVDGSYERAQQLQSQLEREGRELQDRESEVREAQGKLPPKPPLDAESLTQRQTTLRVARGRLGEYERERQNYETLRGQLTMLTGQLGAAGETLRRPNLALLILLGLAGAGLITTDVLAGGDAWPLGVVGGLALLGTAVALLYRGKSSPSSAPSPMASTLERQTSEAESAMETAWELLLESGQALGLDDRPTAAALDSEEAYLESARNSLSAWTSANEALEVALRRKESQEGRVDTAAGKHQESEMLSRAAQQGWHGWLEERGLVGELTVDAMNMFLARVDTARVSLGVAREMRHRVGAIETDIDEFQELVVPLAVRHELPLDSVDRRQMASVADELIKRLDDVRRLSTQREQAKEWEEECRRRLKQQDLRLQSVQKEVANLLTAGGTDDPEEFRRRARQHEERSELERKRDEHRRSLEHVSGPGDRFDAFCEALAGSDPSLLNEESRQLSEYLKEVDTRRNDLREERGGINTELQQLLGEEQSSALRVRRNSLLEQLREHAREWSRLTIAGLLLEKTRQKFERERQPSVIRHAQDFFSNVTGQRYQRLYAPIGEQTITVTDATGAQKLPTALSRGTREQLYLALRFGLIREFGEHAERLPVVVDEALVNFDPERARLAAKSFAELAETNQVLVFTCHPSTVELFTAVGAQVMDIS